MSNTNSVDDRGFPLKVVTIILAVLVVTSFSMRAYVRACMIKSFGMDDWLMTAATVVYVVYTACVLSGIRYGTGRRFDALSESDAQRALEVLHACNNTHQDPEGADY